MDEQRLMGNTILGIGTIKMLALAQEYGKIIDICNELLGDLEEAAEHRLADGQGETYCPGHAAPVVNGYCFDCGLPRRPAAKA